MDIEKYFNDFFKDRKEPTLAAMQYFMRKYNDFQNEMKFIHVAGTNGKGSCVEMISKILEQEGYSVGKLISPHLLKYNERISINGKLISDTEIEELINELEPMIKECSEIEKINVTFFELITIISLLYFYRKKVDFVVLETGLGGLYDSTNVITKPLISVITSIGLDHMKILGKSVREIAIQKAGIIKKDSNTVFFSQSEEIDDVFIETCKNKNNKLHLIKNENIENYTYDDIYQYFDYKEYKNIAVVLKGKMQITNAALCIETVRILNDMGYNILENSIRQGLMNVVHKGRMEILNKVPLIVYDGAHNEPAIKNLQSIVKMYYTNIKRIYIVSILKTKDYKKMIEVLLEEAEAEIIFTSGNNPEKFVAKEELYEFALKNKTNQKIMMKDLEQSLEEILKQQENKKVYFIVGSFYVYGSVKDEIEKYI